MSAGEPAGPADLQALEAEMADFWRRGRARVRTLAKALHPDLDPVAYPLLVQLSRVESVRIGDLGAHLGVDKSTVSRQVDSVVRLGLAHRLPDPDDARARLVALTADGRNRLEQTLGVQLARWRDALAPWPAADVRALTQLLHRLGLTGLG